MTTTDKLTNAELDLIAQDMLICPPHTDQIAAMARELLAHRRASQAAPAPQQKPVAWAETDHKGKVIGVSMNQYPWHPTPLYAAPAPSDGLREALSDMVALFSADGCLLKGTHLNATLARARAAISASPAQDVIIGFSDGDVPCRVCGKVIHLYFNGGELDEARCCGHTYRTEAVGYRLVISASPAQEGEPT